MLGLAESWFLVWEMEVTCLLGCWEDVASLDVEGPAHSGPWWAFSDCHNPHTLSSLQSPLESVCELPGFPMKGGGRLLRKPSTSCT